MLMPENIETLQSSKYFKSNDKEPLEVHRTYKNCKKPDIKARNLIESLI